MISHFRQNCKRLFGLFCKQFINAKYITPAREKSPACLPPGNSFTSVGRQAGGGRLYFVSLIIHPGKIKHRKDEQHLPAALSVLSLLKHQEDQSEEQQIVVFQMTRVKQ